MAKGKFRQCVSREIKADKSGGKIQRKLARASKKCAGK